MNLYETVYTEVVKDVIGNEPVLDQFDIFYEASYYGSTQDEYITGSLLNSVTNAAGERQFLTGERGRVFSKLYANNAPSIPSTYGSEVVNRIPSLSFRGIPQSSKVSRTAYRLIQSYDANERFYDSCLPKFSDCLNADGVQPWFINNLSPTLLSPYNNVETNKVANIIFNFPGKDRSLEGWDKDPTVNNDWTWSYPYEARYNPNNRNVSVKESLGLESTTLSADLTFVDLKDVYTRLGEFWETSVTSSFEVGSINSIRRNTINSFRMILPGNNEGGTNSLLQTLSSPYSGSNGYRYILPTTYEKMGARSSYGYSLLIPSDVNLSSYADHSFLTPYGAPNPGNELLTSSLYLSDSVKILFGFGDLNTVTYSSRTSFEPLNSEITYTESFESNTDGDPSTSISSFDDGYFRVNWNTAGYPNSNRWKVATQQGYTPGSDFFYSGPGTPNSSLGVYWEDDVINMNILYSNTTTDLGGDMNGGDDSYMYLDVTSSYPWSFKFDFAIVSDGIGDYFQAFLTGSSLTSEIGLINTNGGDNNNPNDYFFYVTEDGSEGFPVTSSRLPGTLNSPPNSTPESRSGGTYDWDVIGGKSIGMGDSYYTGSNSYPIPAGEYRLIYRWRCTGGSTVAFTAIDRLTFKTFREPCFPVDTSSGRMGGNNYPEFRSIKFDDRKNPIYNSIVSYPSGWDDAKTLLERRSGILTEGINYGVSPVIRGWKYGLVSGFPEHTKMVFRRGRYGQLRDALEQRKFSRSVNSGVSPTDLDAITFDGFDKSWKTTLSVQNSSFSGQISEGPVSVRFVHKIANPNSPRGIGVIQTRIVAPEETTSQNLSPYVTSSLPYFDGVPRHRTDEEMSRIRRVSFVDPALYAVVVP